MRDETPSLEARPERSSGMPRHLNRTALALTAAGVIYAAFAGLRTVGNPDLGWQLATGRWIVQHHSIPSFDVLSYTAAGNPWVYPALSQVLFYLLYLAGGFAALSWLSDIACVAITAMLSRGNLVTRCLSILLVPLIANRTVPRAEMFSELFFAAFLTILWSFRHRGKGPLWLLPVLMLLWVNTHLGFISGIAVFGAYSLFELEACIAVATRGEALVRLRRAVPWMLIAALATVCTPFGIHRNYEGMARLMPVQSSGWISELRSVPVNLTTLAKAFDVRDPRSAVWMFILIAVVAIVASLFQRRLVAATVLGVALAAVIHSARFSTLFAILVTVIGGEILADLSELSIFQKTWTRLQDSVPWNLTRLIAVTACSVLILLVTIRVADLVSNRYYIRVPQQSSSFGTGEAFWYPEDAARFIQENRLPGNLFNDYNSGGFVGFRLGPEYPVYIDGRGSPFGDSVFSRSLELETQRLDSELWKTEAESRHINTVFVSLDMEFGAVLSNLRQYCESSGWDLVFMDAEAAVFTRSNENNKPAPISCDSIVFDHPPQFAGGRGRAERFRYYRNASAILLALGRDLEAQQMLSQAEQLFPDNMATHYLRGVLFQNARHYADAERELRRACVLEPGEQTWRALAVLYRRQRRLPQVSFAIEKAIQFSPNPQNLYLELGFVQLSQGLPAQALVSFDKAEAKHGPNLGNAESTGFYRYVKRGRAKAWSDLASMYQLRGQLNEARNAQRQAEKFGEVNNAEGGSVQ